MATTECTCKCKRYFDQNTHENMRPENCKFLRGVGLQEVS